MLRREAEQLALARGNSCMCPISHALMREPVVAADGHFYERVEIEKWVELKGVGVKSPKTNISLAHMLIPNHALKSMIDEAVENAVRALRAFAEAPQAVENAECECDCETHKRLRP